MTPTVTIEIAKKSDVLRVPVAALRFRPTADMFAAFNQEMPADLMGGQRRGQGNAGGPGAPGAPGAGAAPPAAAPSAAPAAAPRTGGTPTAQAGSGPNAAVGTRREGAGPGRDAVAGRRW